MAFDMRGHGETTTKDDLDLSSKTLSAVPTPCLPNLPCISAQQVLCLWMAMLVSAEMFWFYLFCTVRPDTGP